ncbi:hypothetical protein J5N97_019660 [Dioscorea zingiberensis]|uniref:DUF1645 family protein n=1 Tax=Dioscorea zingiberensis TaxID=325984 RepID=A0A9D5HCH9_9LILI|nr:hypothetical protein J5N97_019660 [Dioscorea zingiberensis]
MADADEPAPPLTTSLSFRDPPSAAVLDSPDQIPATHRSDHADGDYPEFDDEDSDSDFEFAFVARDLDSIPSITADEIFSDGRIRPMYPVFDRALLLEDPTGPAQAPDAKPGRVPLARLLIESREESSTPERDELEGVAPETYCVWAPSPDRRRSCKKSGSTGSTTSTGSSRRWKLRDLVVRRSHSDGKEKFVFINAEENKKGGKLTEKKSYSEKKFVFIDAGEKKPLAEENKKGGSGKVTAHKGPKTFLPYRPDLVGFFASLNGISRTHTPF